MALLSNEELIDAFELPTDKQTAQSFAVGIKRRLADAGWSPRSIDLVATTTGPGSFTGLRIGVTAAKTFAYAVGAKVVGVNTQQVIASQIHPEARSVEVVMDAQRRQFFRARFQNWQDNIIPFTLRSTELVDIDSWLNEPRDVDVLTGPGLAKVRPSIPVTVTCADESGWSPTAAATGQIALALYRQGTVHDLWTLSPQYFRKSAAEEKADTRRKNGKN